MTQSRFVPQARQLSVILKSYASVLLACGFSVILVALGPERAHAVPSFARQTGLACSSCHTTFPELNSFGRMFKLHGYTAEGMKELEEEGSDKAPPLAINRVFPLSVMFQTSLTRTNDQQPGTQNANVEFPQQLSLFLAGEITPHIGTFLQATYTGTDGTFALDNTDFRYANDTEIGGKELLYGVTLNNNPTVEDPWHSTPAWGFPFAAADSAPEPAASALVDGVLAQQVAGIGPYGMWNRHLYANVTVYRTAHIGSPQPPTGFDNSGAANGTIRDVAPYWRVAWQQNLGRNYFEVGTFGLFAQIVPDGVSGASNKYTDLAFDTQYERPFGSDLVSAHLTYIYENQNNASTQPAGGASNRNDKLHTFRLDGIYHWRDRLSLALGYFLIRGSNDSLLYPAPTVTAGSPAPVDGSLNGSPDSDGARIDIGYYPWQNVRVSAQYVVYTEFNGRANNYNGTGRNASGNDTLYLLIWLMY